MAKIQKKTTLCVTGRKDGVAEGTLERHLDVQELPKLLAEGWQMVESTPPDEDGNAYLVLEKDEP